MKRLLIFTIILLFTGSMFALESDPSEVVGYFKLNVTQGGYIAISEPLLPFDSDSGNDIDLVEVLGTQWANQDQCIDMQAGTTALFYGSWFGTLTNTEFDLSHTYWISRNAANPDLDFYLVGTVNPSVVSYSINADGYTAFGLNEAVTVALADLGFPTGALQNSDQLLDMQSGQTGLYYNGTWFGTLATTGITPTHTYWIKTSNPTGFTWIYDPGSTSDNSTSLIRISNIKK